MTPEEASRVLGLGPVWATETLGAHVHRVMVRDWKGDWAWERVSCFVLGCLPGYLAQLGDA